MALWIFQCNDNGGKHQHFTIKASDKTSAIKKGFERAKKHAAGDIISWTCQLSYIPR